MNKFPRAPCKYTFHYCEYFINTLIEIIILSISSDFLIIIFRIIFINILLLLLLLFFICYCYYFSYV